MEPALPLALAYPSPPAVSPISVTDLPPPPPRPLVSVEAAEVGVEVASFVGVSCWEELPAAASCRGWGPNEWVSHTYPTSLKGGGG